MIVDLHYINYLNKNNRIYNFNACERIIESFNEKISKFGIIYGEFLSNHNTSDLDMKNVSHKILKIFIENNILKAEIEILNNPIGMILQKYINECVFSTLISGEVFDYNNIVIVKDFHTIEAIYYKDDAYYNLRIRRKKLERILND